MDASHRQSPAEHLLSVAENATTDSGSTAGTASHQAPPPLVAARGATWRVVAIERGDRCSAFRLVRVDPPPAGIERTLIEPFDRLTPVEPAGRFRVVSRQRTRRVLLALLTTPRAWQTPSRAAAAAIDLLPWQLIPAMSFLAGASRRILIADGVGLGKTIEAGLIIDEVLDRRPWARVLVLTPAGLRVQWREELAARFGRVAVIADLGWLAHETHVLPADVNPWATLPLLICSWDFAKRTEVLPGPDRLTWDLAVIDEVHALGTGTERAALAESVARRARGVILLTATPPDGDPVRTRALMNLGARPGEPPPLVVRRSRASMAPVVPRRRWTVIRVSPGQDHRHLQALLAQYTARVEREGAGPAEAPVRLALHVLRKRAASCAWALATTARRRRELLAQAPSELTQPTLPLVTGPEADLTDEVPDDWLRTPGLGNRRAEIAWLARIEDAARIASRTERKLVVLRRLVTRVREPVLAFTEYRDTLLHLAARLRDLGDVALLHGDLGPGERQRVIESFTRGRVRLLLSTDVASEGLNLHQRCRLVVMLDLPWSPSRLEQRIGRLDRLGQRRRVHAIALVSDSPLEGDLLGRLHATSPATAPSPPIVDDEAATTMGQTLRLLRENLQGLQRDTEGRTDPRAPRLMRDSSDGALGTLDARRLLISLLPRRGDRQDWSGMLVVVEGCLTAADATPIDRSVLGLHVPLPVPHLANRSAMRRFVGRHLECLGPHLIEVSRAHLAPRWRVSKRDWERFTSQLRPSGVPAGEMELDPARGVQPSLFDRYDQRPGSRARTFAGTASRWSSARPPDATRASDQVHEHLSLAVVLLRQGPGTAPCSGRTDGSSRP